MRGCDGVRSLGYHHASGKLVGKPVAMRLFFLSQSLQAANDRDDRCNDRSNDLEFVYTVEFVLVVLVRR